MAQSADFLRGPRDALHQPLHAADLAPRSTPDGADRRLSTVLLSRSQSACALQSRTAPPMACRLCLLDRSRPPLFRSRPLMTPPAQMIYQRGRPTPHRGCHSQRAGCDVGAMLGGQYRFENIGSTSRLCFGRVSGGQGAQATDQAQPISSASRPLRAEDSAFVRIRYADLLLDEPRGYTGFKALFGNKYVAAANFAERACADMRRTFNPEHKGNPAFPTCSTPRAQTLAISRQCSRRACRWFTLPRRRSRQSASPVRAVPLASRPATVEHSPPTLGIREILRPPKKDVHHQRQYAVVLTPTKTTILRVAAFAGGLLWHRRCCTYQ